MSQHQAMLSSLLTVAQTSAPMYNGGSGLKTQPPERVPPPPSQQDGGMLEFVLFLDRELSRWLCVCSRPRRPVMKLACLLLEWSGHGVVWFAICGLLFLLYLLTSDPSHLSLAWNVLVLLAVDIVAVASMKLYFKRSRPPTNSGTIALSVSSVDKYAFPSGHASRAVALAIYFTLSRFLPPLVWAGWAVLVCLSRVVGGRHHLLDVLVGAGAGLAVFETSRYLGLLTLSF